jgi:uncharacterized protein (TIGR02594 family)
MAGTPKWLLVMRAITGLTETPGSADNPKILAMRDYIARTFPKQADYCAEYHHDDTPWCGLCADFCMAVCGISGPFGPTDTDRWMWALAWDTESEWGQHLSRPVEGCVVIMEREGGGHVTFFEYEKNGRYYCRGGNQSDMVNLSDYDPDTVVALVWPRAAGEAPGPDDIPVEDRPMLERGDEGPDVFDLQTMLNDQNRAGLEVDGDFGSATEDAVTNYQKSRQLEVDGIAGQETWQALYDKLPPHVPKPPPGGLSPEQVRVVCKIAIDSEIAEYDWDDRGEAPPGYTKGVACAFASTYLQWKAGYGPAVEMARAATHDEDHDALAWYASEYKKLGMDNSKSGANTLRHLWVLIMGLGMRESSGKHCCGRDQSVPPGYYGPVSTTTEAGAWQTSYDAHGCSDEFDRLFDDYNNDKIAGYLEVFKEDVSCSNDDWECWGDGDGYRHQQMSKELPAYAAEVNGITLRNLRKHYGPINEKAAEICPEADEMLKEVQDYIDQAEEMA